VQAIFQVFRLKPDKKSRSRIKNQSRKFIREFGSSDSDAASRSRCAAPGPAASLADKLPGTVREACLSENQKTGSIRLFRNDDHFFTLA
jgi:hypothetical protein